MADNNSVFRKKSLDRVSSPEQLDTYLKVTSVSVWVILCAIILMLIGAVVWGTYGKIESSVEFGCIVENKGVSCFIKESDAAKIKEDMTIIIDEEEYAIESINLYGQYKENSNDKGLNISGADNNEFVYLIKSNGNIADGVYKAKIVTERISPLKFVFN